MIQIELRNIKHAAFASEETLCYSATLYADGVKLGEVSNDGHGGCDMFHPAPGKSWADYNAADARVKAEHPPLDMTAYGMAEPMAQSLECLCATIVEQEQERKRLARMLKASLLFFKTPPTGEGAALYSIKLKGHPASAAALVVKRGNPDAVILNGMPEAEALALLAMAA